MEARVVKGRGPWSERPNHPKAIFVQVTTACNGRCRICPHGVVYGGTKPQEMDSTTWRAITDSIHLHDYTGQVGLYLMGEPLLDSQLATRLEDIWFSPAWALVSTNGALLTKAIGDMLLQYPPRVIHFDIQGGTEEVYEAQMGLPWAETMSRIRAFVDRCKTQPKGRKPRIIINIPMIGGPEYVDVPEIAARFPDCQINPFYANSRGGLVEAVTVPRNGTKSPFYDPAIPHCYQPSTNLCVLVDGSVPLCCMDWARTTTWFGNVHTHDLLTTIYPRVKAEEDLFRKGVYTVSEMCMNCAKEMGWKEEER